MRSTGEWASGGGSAGDGVGREAVSAGFGVPVFPVPADAAAVLDAIGVLAGTQWRGLDDDTCLGLFDALETVDRLFHSARFGLLAELDARDLTDRRLGHTVANEAGWRHGADPRRVRRDLRTAATLRHLPRLADALRHGELPVDRVREITRVANDRTRDTLAAIQDELVDVAAASSTWTAFARDVAQIGSYADGDGAEPPRPRDHASIVRSGDTVNATVDLYGPTAVGFADRLEAEADRLHLQAVRDHEQSPLLEVPARSELLARAFVNLVERGAAATDTGTRTGPAADITLVIDVDTDTVADLFHDGTLLPGPRHDGPVDWSKRAMDLTGARLRHSSREWEMLTCDPTYTWILIAADGHPVACRRDERHASTPQRRALAVRDGHCVFPGCDRPASWCDAHHVTRHTDGGPTTIDNLALLCRHHHGVIHRTGWHMTLNPHTDGASRDGADGNQTSFFTITTPDGARLPTHHDRPPRQDQPPRQSRPAPA